MRFSATHRTTYSYSVPVFLAPHTIRLRPRSGPGQHVRAFELDIDPTPDGITGGMDAWGNDSIWTWFSGKHERLTIVTRFIVDRLRENPFDYLVPAESDSMPPIYAAYEMPGLIPYLMTEGPAPEVERLAKESLAEAKGDIVAFLGDLAARINGRCETVVRPTGDPYAPEELLTVGEGSCRDLAVLYVEACRRVGVAARFVSGYVADHPQEEPRELHAWAGVYVPGGGWRGYDPTQGLATSTGHVRLAAAASPAGAAPVTGTFSGDGSPTSEISYEIEMDVEELPAAGDGRT